MRKYRSGDGNSSKGNMSENLLITPKKEQIMRPRGKSIQLQFSDLNLKKLEEIEKLELRIPNQKGGFNSTRRSSFK
jgi:hypothetical protein